VQVKLTSNLCSYELSSAENVARASSLLPKVISPPATNPLAKSTEMLAKQALFASRNPWSGKTKSAARLDKYYKDSATQRLSWMNKTKATLLPEDQKEEMNLLQQIQTHRHQAIIRLPEVKIEDTKAVVGNLQFYLNNMQEQQNIVKLMCEEPKRNDKTFWQQKNLPEMVDPKTVYPSRGDLVKETAFGKPNVLKSYTVIPALPQILCHIFKSFFLDEESKKNLCAAIPKAQFLLNKIIEYQQWDFRCLRHQTLIGNPATSMKTAKSIEKHA
jgi:hypothetical protein